MTIALGMPTVRAAPRPEPAPPTDIRRSPSQGLRDRFGRTAVDLRVSLTERCNLRCTYCMPAQGLPHAPVGHDMNDDEVLRIVRVAVRDLGVTKVRLTGGEPLLRRSLVDIVAGIAALGPRPEIAMTTNGVGLASRAQALASAGLDRVTVSLDSLHPATAAAIARRPLLPKALDGIEAAKQAGLPIKINTVLVRGVNDHEAPELVAWALANGYELRFIEQMPLDADARWSRMRMVGGEETRTILAPRFRLAEAPGTRKSSPARRYNVWDSAAGPGEAPIGHVGFIDSVSQPFCSECTRTRLTADGRVRACLFSRRETDLLSLLRGGASDAELADAWREAMWAKPHGHGINEPDFTRPRRSMSEIGG